MTYDRAPYPPQAPPGAETMLREVLQHLAGASSAHFYRTLAQQLARAFGAPYAAVLSAQPGGRVRELGAWHPAVPALSAEYAVAGTAAADVLDGRIVYAAAGARAIYAHDTRLARVPAESYLGVPIVDSRGDVLGLIEIFSHDRMEGREPAETILIAMAERVVVEIEREQAEAALRDSEMRYRALIDDSFHLVAEVVDERLIFVSAGYTETLGHVPEDVLGGSMYDLIHPDDRRIVASSLQSMAMEHRAAHFTARMRTSDGRWRSIESTARAFHASSGEHRTTIFSRDITDQLTAEATLREREERSAALLQNVQAGVFLVDRDTTILVANHAAAAILGVPAEELVGRTLAEIDWQCLDMEENHPPVIVSLETKQPVRDRVLEIESRMHGTRRWLLVSSQPLFDGAGEVSQVVCSFSDITARRTAEQELRASEERFRSFAEHTTDLVLGVRGSSVVDYASPNSRTLLGIPPEKLHGSRALDLVHPDDVPPAVEAFRIAAERRTTAERVLRVRHNSGETRWFQMVANFYDNEAGELRAVVTARDITDRHLAEQALRESEQRLRGVIQSAPLVLAHINSDGIIMMAAGEGLSALSLSPDVIVGRNIRDMFDSADATRQEIDRALSGEERATVITLGERSFDTHLMPVRDDDGSLTSVIAVAYDITARLAAETALRESEETSRALLNAPTDGAVLVDRDGTILAYNATAERRFHEHAAKRGVEDAESFVGACVFDLFPPDLRAQRKARNDEIFANGERRHFEDERDGVWTDVTIDPVRDAEGRVVRLAIFSRDITDRKRDEAVLRKRSRELEALNDYLEKTSTQLERSEAELRDASEQLADLLEAEQTRSKTDQLTGALNHGAITEVTTEFIEADVSFALAMVDVDGMKAINDTFGHQAGDSVLLEVTRAITRGGAVAGRYGGDEFLVALLNADAREAETYKAVVEVALHDAVVTDPESGARVPVIASVGFAVFPDEGRTLAELVERADARMYAEKRARQGGGSGLSSSRMVGGERAARMVGELVPLLTSAESLDDKLRLVSHRLSVGAGYAGVSFDVFSEQSDGGPALGAANQNAFARAPQDVIEAWNEHQRSGANNLGVADLLRETRKPLVIPEIATSPYLTEDQKKLLGSIGICSGIVIPLFTADTMIATMSVGSKELNGFDLADEQFLTAVAGQVAAIIRMARLVEHLQQATDRLGESRDETVMLLAAAAEAHSQGGMHHFQNVRELSELIAVEMGFDGDGLRELGLAAALHDVGKIRVPDALLSSGARVTPGIGAAPHPGDWELLRAHCEHGRSFLEGRSGFELAARVAYTHHERYDGAGYPEGLAGEAIPLESAIIAVADSIDAMLSDRAYQHGISLDAAVREAIGCRGTQFHPGVIDALERIYLRGELTAWWQGKDDAAAAA